MRSSIGVRIAALMLIVGGVIGIGIGIYMGYQFLQQHWIYLVLAAAFLVVFVWSVITGIRLWKNDDRGWKWSKILFAAQIPIVTLPGCSYEYFTGAAFKVVSGNHEENFKLSLGATITAYLDTRITDVVLGVNIIAVVVLFYLLWQSRSNKPLKPAANAAAE